MSAASPAPSSPRRAARLLRSAALALLFGAIVLVPLTATVPAAHADDQIGIAAQPAGADGGPDGRTRFSYTSLPGQSVSDVYRVSNTGSAAQAFTVLATDAFNDEDGTFGLLTTATEPTDVGTWVHLEGGGDRIEFTLQPGESRVIPFTVDVPAQAGPGDHAGGLVASVVSSGDQVNLDRRVGTRLYVRVPGDIQAMLTVSSIEAHYGGDWWNPFNGTVTLKYTVTNTGNIALASNVTAGVRTWFGIESAGQRGAGLPELLPGSERSITVEVPGVGQWGYLNPWVTLNPFVDGGDDSKQMRVYPTSRDTVAIAVPWVLLIVLAIIAGVWYLRRWLRRRDETRAAAWIEYVESEAKRTAESAGVPSGSA